MNKAIIRDAASNALLCRHPELTGLVSFDIDFNSGSSFHLGFDLIVRIHNHKAYMALKTIVDAGAYRGTPLRNLGIADDLHGVLDQVLDHYRVAEDGEGGFTIEKNKWLIGDGDDGGAVVMTGSFEARVWVRTWWEEATS